MSTEKMIPIDFPRNITPFVPGDVYYNNFVDAEFTMDQRDADEFNNADPKGEFNTYFIVSFANRPNATGKQPVDDDVVVDCVGNNGTEFTDRAQKIPWLSTPEKSSNGAYYALVKWKLNHAALLAKFKEQGANTVRQYDDQEAELATHYSGNNNTFHRKCNSINRKSMVLNDAGRWIYSDCTTNAELDSDEFWKLDGKQIIEPVTVPEFPSEFYQSDISQVIEPVLSETWLIDQLKGNPLKAGDVISVPYSELPPCNGEIPKPVFTQEMADDGELPPVGSCFIDDIDDDGVHIIAVAHHEGKVIYFYGDEYLSATASECRPIDNRTDEQRAVDDLIEIMQSDEHSYPEIIGLIKAGKIHGVKWIIE